LTSITVIKCQAFLRTMLRTGTVDWLAKIAEVEIGALRGRTPNILYANTERFKAPEFAEMALPTPFAENDIASTGTPGYPPYPVSCESFAAPLRDSEPLVVFGPPEKWPPTFSTGEKRKFGLCVMPNAVELYQNPKAFAERLAAFKSFVGQRALLYAPGAATPANLAVLAYAGIDLLDDLQCILAARNGLELFHGGHAEAGGSSADILYASRLALHSELRHVRRQVEQGRLREYAEYKSKSDPRAVELLRHLDLRHYDAVERFVPVSGPEFRANAKSSLHRPDVERWRRRIAERYRRPVGADILLLLPCSARKPYSRSQSHRLFAEAVTNSGAAQCVHEVIVTSPLGVVPRELECTYPAKEYDIPVTGDWDRDEQAMVRGLLERLLKAGEYKAVVAHLGSERSHALDAVRGAAATAGHPTSREALRDLQTKLAGAAKSVNAKPSWGDRQRAEMESLATFQFGDVGKALLEGCKMKDRQGLLVVLKGEAQVASFSRARGLLSLTLAGGTILAAAGSYCVEIEDFRPKGNVFAVGVASADPCIRIGDDVAVVCKGEVRAVGVAQMDGVEMARSPEGEAVHVRHKIS